MPGMSDDADPFQAPKRKRAKHEDGKLYRVHVRMCLTRPIFVRDKDKDAAKQRAADLVKEAGGEVGCAIGNDAERKGEYDDFRPSEDEWEAEALSASEQEEGEVSEEESGEEKQ